MYEIEGVKGHGTGEKETIFFPLEVILDPDLNKSVAKDYMTIEKFEYWLDSWC